MEESLTGNIMVCLDTSILIDYLNGNEGIIRIVKSYLEREKLSTTSITEYELLKHPDETKREEAQEFLLTIKVYNLDQEAAKKSSQIYRDLKMRGKPINENDILIAGIAMTNKESILTRDPDFKHIEESNRIIVV